MSHTRPGRELDERRWVMNHYSPVASRSRLSGEGLARVFTT